MGKEKLMADFDISVEDCIETLDSSKKYEGGSTSTLVLKDKTTLTLSSFPGFPKPSMLL